MRAVHFVFSTSLVLLVGVSYVFSETRKMDEECYRIVHSEDADPAAVAKCRSEFLTVMVTAARHEQELKKTPAAVSLVTPTELQRSTADTVAEALRDVPGVDLVDAGQPGLKRIRIRGEEARRVAFLIDGQEFIDQRDVGTPLLIAPEMIERIEVVRGPASVLYGTKAVGGVVNFITKKGGYHPVQVTTSFLADGSTNGTREYGSVYGSYSGFDYRLSAMQGVFGDRKAPDGEIKGTGFEYDSLDGYLGKRWDNQSLGFQWTLFNADTEVHVDPAEATTPPLRDFQIDVPERDREKFALFYDWKDITNVLKKVHLDGYYQVGDRRFNTYSDTALTVPFPLEKQSTILTESQLDTWGATNQYDLELAQDNLLVVGVNFVLDNLDQQRTRDSITNGKTDPTELVNDEATQRTVAGFVQDEWYLFDTWNLTVGARQYWVDSELESSSRSGLAPHSSSDAHAVGSIALGYSPTENSTSWLRFAQGYVSPSLSELGTGAFAGANFVSPNADLKPETSDTIELGYRFDDKTWNAEVSLFHSWAEDYIDHVLCSATDQADCIVPSTSRDRVYVNIDEARSFGAESSLSYHLNEFTPYGSASWIRRKFESETYSTYETGLPTVAGRTGLRYETTVDSNVRLWADAFLRAETDSNELKDGTSLHHKAGWATYNMSLGANFGAKQELKLVLEFLNLSDKEYTPATENLLGAGRSVLFKLVLDL